MSTLTQRKKGTTVADDDKKTAKKEGKGGKVKKSKLAKLDDEDDEDEEGNTDIGLNYGEDDEFYKKWGRVVLLGPFLIAIFAMFTIVAGQLVLNNWTGSCGYDLECK